MNEKMNKLEYLTYKNVELTSNSTSYNTST